MKNINKLSDYELAFLLKEGNEMAFEAIYKKYWYKLLAIAGRRLGNLEDAEEAIQNIFLNLWNRRESFKLLVGFDNYFAVATKFEIINQLAKKAREAKRNQGFAQELQTQVEIPLLFDLALLQKQLEDTISTLPGKCQLVFRMSRQDEYTNRKIAQELNLSEKTVEKHITSALKVLRKRFGEHLPLLLLFF